MKAVSLKPPWPWAIFHAGKDVENRTWKTGYRGPLLIHASKTWDWEGYYWITRDPRGPRLDMRTKAEHPHGFIVGKVDLVDCVTEHDSRWFFGPWGWIIKNPIEFKEPIPWRGSQGIFEVPEGLLRAVG